MSTTTAPPRFNPFSAEFRRDPYSTYARLREHRPVHRTMGMWVLTGHRDVHAVLADRTFSSRVIPQLVREATGHTPGADTIEALGAASLVFTDDPDHARLRGLVNTVFTRAAVEAVRPLVNDVAAQLADRAFTAGHADAVADVAALLPVQVLCRWMALPPSVAGGVVGWTRDIRLLLEPGLMKRGVHERVAAVVTEFTTALREVIRARRRDPGTDLVSALATAHTAGGDTLTDDEAAHVAIMCFVAGVETTQSLIGNALRAILTRPEIAETLNRRPDLVSGAVVETLRHDSPLQMTKRVATRECTVGGNQIAEGDQLLLCLGSANRDPAVFTDPDIFDPARPITSSRSGGHLAFGHGMHGCLGGALAQLQAETALTELLQRDLRPEIASADADLEWQDHSLIIRGLARLPITLRSRW